MKFKEVFNESEAITPYSYKATREDQRKMYARQLRAKRKELAELKAKHKK